MASLVAQRLRAFPQLDPRAVLAVAAQEGLGGGVGDNGTSFGPFQLHQGGAYPSSAPQNPQQAQQWAWSPQGIDYALGQQAGVAGGLKGPAAVQALVTRFERPANPQAEVAGALRSYGAVPAAEPAAPNPAVEQPQAAPSPRQAAAASVSTLGRGFAQELIQSAQSLLGGGTPNLSRLFTLAAGFQQARQQMAKAPLGAGTPLVQTAGMKLR